MGYRDTTGKWVDSCLDKLKPGEPFVVLRGQDILAPAALLKWCDEAVGVGVPTAKVAEMMDTIREMKQWEPRKIPD